MFEFLEPSITEIGDNEKVKFVKKERSYAEEFLWYKSNKAFTGMENKES